MHSTRFSASPSAKSSRPRQAAANVSFPSEHADLPYNLRSIRYRESVADLTRLWDPSLLERLHAPLTRFHE